MLTEREELGAWLRLLQTPGIGPQTARQLLAAFGPPAAIWAQSPTAWKDVVGPRTAQAMAHPPGSWAVLLETTWAWLQDGPHERAIVTLGDPDYPTALLQTADPPCLLYATGRIQQLQRLQRLCAQPSSSAMIELEEAPAFCVAASQALQAGIVGSAADRAAALRCVCAQPWRDHMCVPVCCQALVPRQA